MNNIRFSQRHHQEHLRPMYKLLIIMLKHIDYTFTNNIGAFSFVFNADGLCGLNDILHNDLHIFSEKESRKVYNYIQKHPTFSYFFRSLLSVHIDRRNSYYWRAYWILPRKWYLIRHIAYCYIYYQFVKLFNNSK